MQILCAFSSITFSCDHFPGSLTSRESYHPIFNLPQKKLLSYTHKWATSELTETDSYLLFLAALKSTDLVHFRVPAVITPFTSSIIANNMEHLMKVIPKLNTVREPSRHFPNYVISPETKTLANVNHWISNWNDSYDEYKSGKGRDYDERKLVQKEAAIERLIHSKHIPLHRYSKQIADWAAIAGNFPTFNIKSPFTGLEISCADYWKQIIQKCASENSLFSIRRTDIIELQEHCEDNIPIGTIFSNKLFSILRYALEKQKNFLSLGDFDIPGKGKPNYQLLEESDTIEDANIRAMIQSAPEIEPTPDKYPTKLAYMKAKVRWDMAISYGKRESK